jgi:NADH-quinone oxidoreductase subunit H
MSEAELVAGFQTEYSAMSFGAVLARRIRQRAAACAALGAVLFLGRLAARRFDWAPLYARPGGDLAVRPQDRSSFFFVFSWVKGDACRATATTS